MLAVLSCTIADSLQPLSPSHPQHDTVQIASDGGRVCRPLIICDKGVPRVKDEHLRVGTRSRRSRRTASQRRKADGLAKRAGSSWFNHIQP